MYLGRALAQRAKLMKAIGIAPAAIQINQALKLSIRPVRQPSGEEI